MSYLAIFLLTLLCCLIFECLGIGTTVRKLTNSYKLQLETIKDKALTDEDRQKAMLRQTPVQLKYLAKLVGSILLFIFPFLILILLAEQMDWFQMDSLYSVPGILLSLVAVVVYVLLKKAYVRLFKS